MPELPEVETVRRALADIVPTAPVGRVHRSRARMRGIAGTSLSLRPLVGLPLTRVDRVGKVLLLRFGSPAQVTCAVHLGMSGRLLVVDRWERRGRATCAAMELGPGLVLRLDDPRRFGGIGLRRAGPHQGRPDWLALGPDALDEPTGPAALLGIFHRTRRPVFDVLLDQRRIAGIGSIYAQEVLHAARVDPRAPASSLPAVAAARIAAAIPQVLAEAVAHGGTTLKDFSDPFGRPGRHARHLRAYGRAGLPCPCGATLACTRLSGRTVAFCPRCQGSAGRPDRGGAGSGRPTGPTP